MSQPLIARAWRVLREESLSSFWFKFLAMIGYRRLCLLERSLAEPIPALPAGLPVTMEWLQENELARYVAVQPGREVQLFAERLAKGQRCLTARLEGRIVAGMWAAREHAWVGYVDCPLPLAADEVYLFDAFTDPAYRGHALAPALSAELLRRFKAEGCRRALRATLPENQPALRAHAKAGFRPCGRIGRVKVGSWRWDFRRVCR